MQLFRGMFIGYAKKYFPAVHTAFGVSCKILSYHFQEDACKVTRNMWERLSNSTVMKI